MCEFIGKIRAVLLFSVITTGLLACDGGAMKERPSPAQERLKENINIELKAGTDTTSINQLINEGFQKIKKSDSSAYRILRDAFRLSNEIGYHAGKAHSLYYMAAYFQKSGTNRDNIIPFLRYALREYYYAGNKKSMLLTKRHLLNFYFHEGHYQLSVDIFNQYRVAPQEWNEIGPEIWGKLNMEVARAFFKLGKYDSSIAHYQTAIDCLAGYDQKSYEAFVEANIGMGIVWARLQEFDKALAYFDSSLTIAERFSDSITTAFSLINKGCVYFDQGKYDSSYAIFSKALIISESNGQANLQSACQAAIARIFIRQEKYRDALTLSMEALHNAKRSGFFNEIVDAYLVLGQSYLSLHQYENAKKSLTTGLQLATSKKQVDDLSSFYEQLATTYFHLQAYEEAYTFKDKYIHLKEELTGRDNARLIAEINAKYQLARKDKELSEKQLEIERQQKKQYIWIGVALLFIIFLSGLLYRKKHKASMEKLKAKLEGEEKERERLAKELHDGIVSRLSVIKTNFSALPQYHQENGKNYEFQEAINQLDETITELRTTSHNLLPEILRRAGLTESLRIFCDNINEAGNLDITFQTVNELPDLTDEFQLNIYRIVQEILQNIIKHAGAKQALVQLNATDDSLEITIDDDGIHYLSQEMMDKRQKTGVGMHSLQSRIKLLGGIMEIERHKGTSVYLSFDFKKFRVKPMA